MWILLGYASNILRYPSKYYNYTSKKKLWRFPHFPRPPQWITFLIFISQKILLNIKHVEFNFRMGCILVLFSSVNNKRAIYKFLIFRFFLFSNIVILAYFIKVFGGGAPKNLIFSMQLVFFTVERKLLQTKLFSQKVFFV